MSQVLVWKSDADGKLFEDKAKYQKHLRKLARARQEARKVEQAKLAKIALLDRMGQVGSIDELNQFIKDNWEFFYYNGAEQNIWRRGKPDAKRNFHEYVDVQLTGMTIANLGNTHSCPRNGGMQNFMQKDDIPKRYPGWTGRINIKVRPPSDKYKGRVYLKDGYGSDYFDGTGICTGSGGGGGGEEYKSYSYDVKIWAADFPVMWKKEMREIWISKENRNRQRAWQKIGGGNFVPVVTEVPEDWVVPDPLIASDLLDNRW